jgi:hypothetical protein
MKTLLLIVVIALLAGCGDGPSSSSNPTSIDSSLPPASVSRTEKLYVGLWDLWDVCPPNPDGTYTLTTSNIFMMNGQKVRLYSTFILYNIGSTNPDYSPFYLITMYDDKNNIVDQYIQAASEPLKIKEIIELNMQRNLI